METVDPGAPPLRVPRRRIGPAFWLAAGVLTLLGSAAAAGRDPWYTAWIGFPVGLFFVVQGTVDLRTPLLEFDRSGMIYRPGFPRPGIRLDAGSISSWRERLGMLVVERPDRRPLDIDWSHLDDGTRGRVRERLRDLGPERAGRPQE